MYKYMRGRKRKIKKPLGIIRRAHPVGQLADTYALQSTVLFTVGGGEEKTCLERTEDHRKIS